MVDLTAQMLLDCINSGSPLALYDARQLLWRNDASSIAVLCEIIEIGTVKEKQMALELLSGLPWAKELDTTMYLQFLIQFIEKTENKQLRDSAVVVLSKFICKDSCKVFRDFFYALLLDESELVRLFVANKLGETGDEGWEAYLNLLLDDESPYVQVAAYDALRRNKSANAFLALQEWQKRQE